MRIYKVFRRDPKTNELVSAAMNNPDWMLSYKYRKVTVPKDGSFCMGFSTLESAREFVIVDMLSLILPYSFYKQAEIWVCEVPYIKECKGIIPVWEPSYKVLNFWNIFNTGESINTATIVSPKGTVFVPSVKPLHRIWVYINTRRSI